MDIRVQKGDNIWKIAKAKKPEGVALEDFVKQIIDANPQLADPDKLQIGDTITVPGVDVPLPRERPPPPEEVWRAREEATRNAMMNFKSSVPSSVGQEVDITLPRPRPEFFAQGQMLPSPDYRQYFTMGDPGGLVEEGNINLASRSRQGTIKAKALEWQGQMVIVPMTQAGGREMGDAEALKAFIDTGDNYGKFDDEGAAVAYAERLALGIGTPERDPDAYIDTNSPRFFELLAGEGQAHHDNMMAWAAKEQGGLDEPIQPLQSPEGRALARNRREGERIRRATAERTARYGRLEGSQADPNAARPNSRQVKKLQQESVSMQDKLKQMERSRVFPEPSFQPTRPSK